MEETQSEMTGREVDVDGLVDEEHSVVCVGKAYEMTNGKWMCLAGVEGSMCIVEIEVEDE